jgi:hypothetical protein
VRETLAAGSLILLAAAAAAFSSALTCRGTLKLRCLGVAAETTQREDDCFVKHQ